METESKTRLLALASECDEVKNYLVIIRDCYWMGNRQDLAALLFKSSLRDLANKLLEYAYADGKVSVFVLKGEIPSLNQTKDWLELHNLGGMVLENVYNFELGMFTKDEHISRFFRLLRTTPLPQRLTDLQSLQEKIARELDSLVVKSEIGEPNV